MQAVNVKVKAFKKLGPDVDMDQVYHPVKDTRGDRCALIKVFNADASYTFGNSKAVRPHGREMWVYVAQETEWITINHNGQQIKYSFEPAEDCVYILTLYAQEDYNKAGAIATSCFVPGMGQIAFKRDYVKGSLILATEAASIAAIVVCNSQQYSYKDKSDRAITADDKVNYMKKSDNYGTARNIMIGVAAGIYVYNILDVILARPKASKGRIALAPYMESLSTSNAYGVNVAVKL